jgi:hypothetical protein
VHYLQLIFRWRKNSCPNRMSPLDPAFEKT